MKYIESKKGLFLLIILVVSAVAAASFAYYISDYYHMDSKATAALESTDVYNVTYTDNSIKFTPTQNRSDTGIIFYPGGKVQPEAYSVISSKLAVKGYTVIIVKMPFNLAFFGVNSADDVISKHPEINLWVIMGHSLGGVFASEYAVNHQDKIKGAVYLAAYPSKNASNATFKALSIRGSLDNLTTAQDISNNKNKFPANTVFITIPGGNHYNNGNYGPQTGDNNSTITREEQQNETVSYIIEFLKCL
ncbi:MULTISPECIES: alpha/beta hydrolase [Methanobacterium]|uniref:Carboxymethylenebutenolidase n=1 Tax=Methanobacterium bryantii TaxID=2161 RepID=A0A2A2H6K2_METBR|nr:MULTISPECIES: alpha/beta hydrolase [Methanobacterium]OEC85847.1 carboxymethylenebutenolidase [Methanobacterium sp. A39]PAV04998.1 carboxymethylenebutenolidase [Methanobacterium bryantii]